MDKQNLLDTADNQYKAFLEAQKRYVKRDFFEFSKEIIQWPDLQIPLHEELCKYVQYNKKKKKLILLPRGHLKSSIITVGYSLWQIAKDPTIRILIANATYDMAVTFLSQIKDHIRRNEKWIEMFGKLGENTDKWAESSFTITRPESYQKKEPTATAFGIGGNLVSQHYDLIIMDDVVNRDNIHTPERIADVHTFYKDALDLLEPTGELIVIGTRWHEGDLYGTILEPTNPERHLWSFKTRTAVEGDYNVIKQANGRHWIEGGEIIFPKKFTRASLSDLINSKGMSEFFAQYMNDPVPSSEAIFKHQFQYYEETDIAGLDTDFSYFMTVDPAFYDPKSRTVDPDYTGIVVIAVDQRNNWYIRDLVRDRFQPKELLNIIFEMDKRWKPITIGLEVTAWQKILVHMGRDMMRERNQFLPITELKHAGQHAKSKSDRIQGLEPRYAVGSIYHKRELRNIASLEMELRRFPRAKTDDLADALASMLEIATPPRDRSRRPADINKKLLYPA